MSNNKKIKAIYSSVNKIDTMLPVAKKLTEENIVPVYWSGGADIREEVLCAFPEVLFHNQKDGLYGKWPESINPNKAYNNISKQVLTEYADIQRVFMEMATTRAGGKNSFAWYEIADYFHKALAGSLALIETLKPDVWISITPPHYMYDYVMYEVCKRKGVKTFMFMHTHLPQRSLFIDSIDYNPKRLINYVAKIKNFTFSDELKAYVQGVRSTYKDGVPALLKEYHNADKYEEHSYKNILVKLKKKKGGILYNFYKTFLKSKFFGDIKNQSNHYLKQSNKHWSDSFMLRKDYLSKRINDINDRISLLKSYFTKVTEVDLEQKYIYFPMNLQPECTTVPQAGVFSDQILSLRMLSSVLPVGWKIYVKEAPNMFKWHRGSFARHNTYYEDIASIDNIEFVPLVADPFLLIDKSQCVVCSTGTAGWEAILRGVPVMMLGDLYWYKGFPGLTDVSSTKEMFTFFEKLKKGMLKIKPKDVDKYIYALYQITYRCSFDKVMLEHFDIGDEENTQQIVQAITDAL